MCSDSHEAVDDRPLTKEEEEALQEFCMIMGDFIEECEAIKTELNKLSVLLEGKDET